MPKYIVKLSEDALDDLLDSSFYYDSQSSGLGDDFLESIGAVIESIASIHMHFNKFLNHIIER